MTIAVCLKCGTQKIGAFTPCVSCGYDPATDTDRRNQAKCLWLSDHHQKPDLLAAIGAQLKSGQPVPWNDALLDQLVTQLATQQNPLFTGKGPIGCTYAVWGLVAVMLALLGAVIFFATRR
jgi:hypothetical protein